MIISKNFSLYRNLWWGNYYYIWQLSQYYYCGADLRPCIIIDCTYSSSSVSFLLQGAMLFILHNFWGPLLFRSKRTEFPPNVPNVLTVARFLFLTFDDFDFFLRYEPISSHAHFTLYIHTIPHRPWSFNRPTNRAARIAKVMTPTIDKTRNWHV